MLKVGDLVVTKKEEDDYITLGLLMDRDEKEGLGTIKVIKTKDSVNHMENLTVDRCLAELRLAEPEEQI